MPETPLYGFVDDNEFLEQEKGLSQLCPLTKKYEDLVQGKGFTHSDKFLASGDPMQIPTMEPDGKGSISKRDKQSQGYKIHVSAHPSKALEVARVVLPLLQQTPEGDNPLGGVNYKVAKLREYALDGNEEQRGKFITIYAKDEEQLKLIAKTVQNELILCGITPEKYGGGLSPGDSKLGSTDMMSMRWGQFTGVKDKQVYLNSEWVSDDRNVPCPEMMKDEYERVLSETNEHMEQNMLELLVEEKGPSVEGKSPSLEDGKQEVITNSNTNPNPRMVMGSRPMPSQTPPPITTSSGSGLHTDDPSTDMDPGKGTEKKEVKKLTVGETLKSQEMKQRRRVMQIDGKTMENVLKGNFPDKGPDDDDKGAKQNISTGRTQKL